jgi:hypothetical protein
VFSFVSLILSLSALALGSYGFARALFSKSLNALIVVLFLLDFLLGMLLGPLSGAEAGAAALAVLFGDASGHGMAAGLVMAVDDKFAEA